MKHILNKVFWSGTFILLALAGCNTDRNKKTEIPGKGGDVSVYLTDQTFREKVFNYQSGSEWKYLGSKPAIIDFYADWCAPCRKLSPILEDVVREYQDSIVLYKVDTEKEKGLASAMGIQVLPTLLYIPLTGEPQVRVGFQTKESLRQSIGEILLSNQGN